MTMPKLPAPTPAERKAADRRCNRALRKWRKYCLKVGVPEAVLQDVLRAWDESGDMPHNQHTLALRMLDMYLDEEMRRAEDADEAAAASWQYVFLRCSSVISTVRQLVAEGKLDTQAADLSSDEKSLSPDAPSVRIRPDRRDGRKPRRGT